MKKGGLFRIVVLPFMLVFMILIGTIANLFTWGSEVILIWISLLVLIGSFLLIALIEAL